MQPARYGYGYGWKGSRLVVLGAVVLLAHGVLCLGFVGWLWVFGMHGRAGGYAGWDSLGEVCCCCIYFDFLTWDLNDEVC